MFGIKLHRQTFVLKHWGQFVSANSSNQEKSGKTSNECNIILLYHASQSTIYPPPMLGYIPYNPHICT